MCFRSVSTYGIAVSFCSKDMQCKKELFKILTLRICEMVLRCVEGGQIFSYVNCHSSVGLN